MAFEHRSDRGELMASATSMLARYQELKELGFVNRAGTFFAAGVHYPPITMYQPITQRAMFEGYRPPEDGLFDIYMHIPFCMKRCMFCHYPVKLGDQESEKDLYLKHLIREMDIYKQVLGVERFKARSVLIGGGTPTFLSPRQLKEFLTAFCARVDLAKVTQFNYDVDPVTLLGPTGEERLDIMRDFGVDRLTIGFQSLDEPTLVRMNRPHTAREAVEAVAAARGRGFHVNVEFIFGYPEQTLEKWMSDIDQAMALDVEEIQMYRLKVDAYGDYQGPIKTLIDRRKTECLTDEDTLVMKKVAIDMLIAKGFIEPIRRVFSRSKSLFSHYAWNQCCLLQDELGFGLTAFSSLGDRFVLNTQHFDEYYASIQAGRLPLNRGLVRDIEEQRRWALVLPLKNSFVRHSLYEKRTGGPIPPAFAKRLELLQEHGLLTMDKNRVQATPMGCLLADELAHQFHHPLYLPVPREAYAQGPLNPYGSEEAIAARAS